MEKSNLTNEEINLMNEACRDLLSMDEKMMVCTVAMALMQMNKLQPTRLIPNLLNLLNGLAQHLCSEHKKIFLEELMRGIDEALIPQFEEEKPKAS